MTTFMCQVCEEEFDDLDEEEWIDCDEIRESGRCSGCHEEWGDEWPDR